MLNGLHFDISEQDVQDLSLVYGNETYEIKYAEFLRDANCLEYVMNKPTTGAKSTYVTKFTNFEGANAMELLMTKVKNMIKKDRIRLREFLHDHDILRKGYLPA